MFVQSTIACSPDDVVVVSLRTMARRPNGMFKWNDVQSFVTSMASEEAARVRRRLEEATIAIVDPAAYLRSYDLAQTPRGMPPTLSRQVQTDPRLAPLRQLFARQVGQLLMIQSGAEKVFALLRAPLVGESGFYGHLARRTDDIQHLDPLVIAERTKDLNKLSRIALQTTALVAHELDPETRTDIAPYIEGFRYGMDTTGYNQARLEALVRRSVVYDRGHEDATSLAARYHEAARARAADCPLNWTDQDQERPLLGEVRVGVTQEEVELQVADVAAGWASHILGVRGALVLCNTFRVVIYNGSPLSRTEAERLDTERRFHDRMIERAP